MSLALREIRRRSGRFAVLASAVTVLVFFLLFQEGLLGGLVEQFVGALRHQDAEVLVYSEQARQNAQASIVSDETVSAVAGIPGVAAAAPLGVGVFTVDTAEERTDAAVFGYELGGPGAPTTLSEGRLPQRPGEAVVSAGAGEGFGIGDVVVGVPGGEEIEVVGLGDELAFSVLPTLFTSFDTYTELRIGQNPDAVSVPPSAVAVQLEPGVEPTAVAEEISSSIPGTEALTRDEAVRQAPGVEAVQQSFAVVLALGYTVVGVVIGFFFLILTTQKLPQLTLLRALGVPAARLIVTLAVQVIVLVVVALVVGGGLAVQALASGTSGIDASLSTQQLVQTATIVGAMAFLAVLASARRIARIDPAHAVDVGGVL